jgi:hypothetical protein
MLILYGVLDAGTAPDVISIEKSMSLLEVDLVLLLGIRPCILLIWGGPLGLVCCLQQIPTPILHIRNTLFCNTSSFEGLIFVSLRHASESLGGSSLSLLCLHILKFYDNSPF